ncbi:hypothetical protein [Bowmanella denitrificans]|uniref:hypothetical protein n=1 Tax=Bowmanella denitrificans TaxID=366582 RepID=UPI000C9C1A1C|nr:hypothetical protein [Bowmanella denitrificans]
MSQILLCNQSLNPQNLLYQCGISIDRISTVSCARPDVMAANMPYLLDEDNASHSRSMLDQLSPKPVAEELTRLSLSLGGDNVVALADIRAKLHEYNVGLMGASTSVYADRIGGFAKSVQNYQAALMEYRKAIETSSPLRSALKQKAHMAHQAMQRQFGNELNAVTAQVRSNRGTPLSNPNRATNIARSSRNVAKLNVSSQIQANNLVKLAKHAKLLGNGLAVIDFGSRVGNVHNTYQAGGHWERELFIESSSFAASALTGTAVVSAGSTALGILIVATPVGWVGLIIGGIAVAGAAAGASIWVNGQMKENSGGWYDDIMKWLGL